MEGKEERVKEKEEKADESVKIKIMITRRGKTIRPRI